MNQKQQSIQFWNDQFKGIEPVKVDPSQATIDNKLDEYLQRLGNDTHNILDIACGAGTCLIGAHLLGDNHPQGLGLDASHHAIEFASKTAGLSGLTKLTFQEGDETVLESIPSNSYDGIICSNFLDVIPASLSEYVISQIKRILAPKGYFLLKVNFYLTEALVEKLHMEEIAPHTYTMKGIIRAYNLTTDEWLAIFYEWKPLDIDGFQRAPNLPEDRIIYFQKP